MFKKWIIDVKLNKFIDIYNNQNIIRFDFYWCYFKYALQLILTEVQVLKCFYTKHVHTFYQLNARLSNKVKTILARREYTSLLLEVKLLLIDPIGLTRNMWDDSYRYVTSDKKPKKIKKRVSPELEYFHGLFKIVGVAPANYTNLDAGIYKGKILKKRKKKRVKVVLLNRVSMMRQTLFSSVKSSILRDFFDYMTSPYDDVEVAFDKNFKTIWTLKLFEVLSVHKRLHYIISLLCEEAYQEYKHIMFSTFTSGAAPGIVFDILNYYKLTSTVRSRKGLTRDRMPATSARNVRSRYCLTRDRNFVPVIVTGTTSARNAGFFKQLHLNFGQIYYFYWKTSKYYKTSLLNASLISLKDSWSKVFKRLYGYNYALNKYLLGYIGYNVKIQFLSVGKEFFTMLKGVLRHYSTYFSLAWYVYYLGQRTYLLPLLRRGLRAIFKYPCRGQRTRSNYKTVRALPRIINVNVFKQKLTMEEIILKYPLWEHIDTFYFHKFS